MISFIMMVGILVSMLLSIWMVGISGWWGYLVRKMLFVMFMLILMIEVIVSIFRLLRMVFFMLLFVLFLGVGMWVKKFRLVVLSLLF